MCNSCGKLERNEFPLIHNCSPLAQYGIEARVDLCPNCNVAQGLVEHVQWMQELYAADYQEQQALLKARVAVLHTLGVAPDQISNTEPTTQLELSPLSHHKLSAVLTSSECAAYSRVSATLEGLTIQFSQGLIGCMEFVELLEHAIGIKDQAMAMLKQQAFRVNGDMGTALKLLAEHALPNRLRTDDDFTDGTVNQNSTELLQCILEFFLDLLDEGELQSVAFFWPQLLNIHLQMLPASDSASLRRVELVEDFLLTVATQHSVQLAVELIWSHTADLEDSKTLSYCAKRRYAVLRFLCELESLLFDFEMGWGGGSVTIGKFLGPSTHQIAILKSGIRLIQRYRLAHPDRLSRSQRRKKLLQEREHREHGEVRSVPSEELATEALRIAKNADYLSTHMAFTKRLGDIAYRLFFQPVEKRKGILEAELAKLNSSGTMGGDPLNRVKLKNYHTRVARIPIHEGHVFRSKERTPVLLLVETLDEEAEFENDKQELTPFPRAQQLQETQDELNNSNNERKKEKKQELFENNNSNKTAEGEEAITTKNDAADFVSPPEGINENLAQSTKAATTEISHFVEALVESDLHDEENKVESNQNATENNTPESLPTSLTKEPCESILTEKAGQGSDAIMATPIVGKQIKPVEESRLCGSQEGIADDIAHRRKFCIS